MFILPTKEKIFESVHALQLQREVILEPKVSLLPQAQRFLLLTLAIYSVITLAPLKPQKLLPFLRFHICLNLFL